MFFNFQLIKNQLQNNVLQFLTDQKPIIEMKYYSLKFIVKYDWIVTHL